MGIDMLSHEYKCIFVHIPKVAGQSIEHVFLNLHGLTWETRSPLLLRANEDPELGPPRLAHLKASEYVSCGHITQEKFDSYFKFAFVRNPWSRLVSIYTYLGYFEVMPFKQFISEDFSSATAWEPHLFIKSQYDYLFDENGKQLVDYIGRFEDLQSGFNQVCSEMGLSEITLPYVNKTKKNVGGVQRLKKVIKQISPFHKNYSVPGSYTQYYDKESIQYVKNLYEKEIDIFEYRFGE